MGFVDNNETIENYQPSPLSSYSVTALISFLLSFLLSSFLWFVVPDTQEDQKGSRKKTWYQPWLDHATGMTDIFLFRFSGFKHSWVIRVKHIEGVK